MSWRKLPLTVRVAVIITLWMAAVWVGIPLGCLWLGRLLGVPLWLPTPYHLLGLIPAVAGAAGCALCVGTFFFRGRGTPAPFDPPARFVTTGPYAYCRNPMMASQFLMLAGVMIALRAWVLGPVLLLAFGGAQLMLTLWEEPQLIRRFGEDYEQYRRRVPQWIPRLTPSGGPQHDLTPRPPLPAGEGEKGSDT